LAAALTTSTFLALGATWLTLGKLEKQFYKGREVPPRNQPEKN
jgi:hypothetical protein